MKRKCETEWLAKRESREGESCNEVQARKAVIQKVKLVVTEED